MDPQLIMALITGGLATAENIVEFVAKLKAEHGITDDQLLEFASKGDADGLARTQAWIAKLATKLGEGA
jgi:hypothetical protein